MSYIDPRELNDLASFAANGGLGRGVATSDCVAELPDQLMFISGDELILLRELEEVDLASCEGVVGWVKKGLVAFQSDSTPKASLDVTRDDLPRTNLIAPSPSPPSTNRMLPIDQPNRLDAPSDSKRVSGPFELDSPQQSPNLDHVNDRFSIQQAAAIIDEPQETLRSRPESEIEVAPIRDSVLSTASSEMYGGIGGFMMGSGSSEESHGTASGDHGVPSPVTTSVETPFPSHSDPPSPTVANDNLSPPRSEEDDEEWDIYEQYARESMYAPMKRMSRAAWRASRLVKDTRESMASYDGLRAARAALEGPKEVKEELDPKTPTQSSRNPLPSPLATGRSVATELRLRIQRERAAAAKQAEEGEMPVVPVRSSSIPKERRSLSPKKSERSPAGSDTRHSKEVSPKSVRESAIEPVEDKALELDTYAVASEVSTTDIDTPIAPEMVTFTGPSPGDSPSRETPALLASPMSLHSPKLEAPVDIILPENVLLAPRPPRSASPMISPTSSLPLPTATPSAVTKLVIPWNDSPSSPHSVTATQQAVEVAKEGRRPRGLTLVGRIDADLRGARGPVPITFVIGDSDDKRGAIGLGLPSGRSSPVTPDQRSRSPLFSAAPPPPPIPDGIENIRQAPSRFPTPQRSFTSPIAPEPSQTDVDTAAGPRPGFFAARPRSRSFSAAMAKVGRKKDTPPAITTDMLPSISTVKSPSSPGTSRLKLLGRKSPRSSAPNTPITATPLTPPGLPREDMPQSGRSSSFSFSSKTSKTPRKASRALPSPVSHRDFEDTVNAGGMDFELVQPKAILSPTSINTLGIVSPVSDDDKGTLASASSMNSLSSRATVPDTDEWGFIKDKSVTPEIFQSRSAPVDHRAAEMKWLGVIGTAVPPGGPPKRVKRYVMEGGVPSSLRGKVWAWFIGSPPRVYKKESRASIDEQIEADINRIWSDHSLFYLSSSPGYTDLRSVLRSYLATSKLAYSSPMCHLAGTMLIHSVAEDAFSLMTGLMEGVLKEYFDSSGHGIATDAGVFDVVLRGSEKELATTFKQVGLKSSEFLDRWYKQLFIRCLPWPTALRVIDVVVSEGPRFLLIASLTILTLSRERLLALPKAKAPLLDYLQDLPQDSLLLPENFMKATERVKFKEEDWKRLRAGVEKELDAGRVASPLP